jgi:hypothetical protein
MHEQTSIHSFLYPVLFSVSYRMHCVMHFTFITTLQKAVPWLRQLVAGLSPRRPGFDHGSVHVRFVVDKVALGQAFPRVFRFSPVNFIPPVLHYSEKRRKTLITFIIVLHNKSQGCGASVASAAGPFTKKKETPPKAI